MSWQQGAVHNGPLPTPLGELQLRWARPAPPRKGWTAGTCTVPQDTANPETEILTGSTGPRSEPSCPSVQRAEWTSYCEIAGVRRRQAELAGSRGAGSLRPPACEQPPQSRGSWSGVRREPRSC